jgi:hypothetical protein
MSRFRQHSCNESLGHILILPHIHLYLIADKINTFHNCIHKLFIHIIGAIFSLRLPWLAYLQSGYFVRSGEFWLAETAKNFEKWLAIGQFCTESGPRPTVIFNSGLQHACIDLRTCAVESISLESLFTCTCEGSISVDAVGIAVTQHVQQTFMYVWQYDNDNYIKHLQHASHLKHKINLNCH